MSIASVVPRLLADDEDFPISPKDIDTKLLEQNFWVMAADMRALPGEQMGNEQYWNEKLNEGAAIVVEAFQKKGNWSPCKPEDLVRSHEEATMSLMHFARGEHAFKGFVVLGIDGICRVTHTFIVYCYLAAGKVRPKTIPATVAD